MPGAHRDTGVADGVRGFIRSATFPAIYVASGWLFSFDFSITDTNTLSTAIKRMFVGFGTATTSPALSAPALSAPVAKNSL